MGGLKSIKRKKGYDDSDSSEDDDDWKDDYKPEEQMYIACRLGQADDNDMSIRKSDISSELRKEAKKACKRLKRS